jgi:hypothetical protein
MKKHMLGTLALLTSFALPALATTEASLSLSNFSVTLKDLNQGDGIMPSISWGSGTIGTGSTDADQQGWNVSGGYASPVWSTGSDLYLFTPNPGTQDQTSLHDHGTQHVSASAAGLDSMQLAAHAEAGQMVHSNGSWSQSVVLSAGTQATFSVTVDASWSASLGGRTPPPGWMGELADSGIYLEFSAGMLGVGTSGSGSVFSPAAMDDYDSAIEGQELKLIIKNTGSTDKTYNLSLSGSIGAEEVATPVPEPSSYAMLGIGLALMGVMARRRRS